MKTWRIPVEKISRGVVKIDAYSLSEALKVAKSIPANKLDVKKPHYTEMPNEPWKVHWDGTEYGSIYIRQTYNNNQEDETPELRPVMHGRFVDGACTNCGWFGDYTDTPYYKFCPHCGAIMEATEE